MMMDKLTALVVDDDPISSGMLENFLTKLGFEVISCTNGKTAYEILMHENEVLDLVITDIIMPDMGGKELLHLIRSNPSTNDLPVVLISGVIDTSELQDLCDSYNKSITKFLTKPLNLKDLQRTLEELHIK